MAAIDQAWRSSGGGAQSQVELLAQSRERVAARLRQALRGVLGGVRSDLLRRGELAGEREQRHFLYGIRDALMEKGVHLESLLAGHWRREFDAATAGRLGARLSVLSLDEPDDREEELALQAIVERLRGRCAAAVEAIGRRLAALSGRDQVGGAAPEVLCKALRGALCEAAFGRLERLELLRSLLPYAGAEFGAVYDQWWGELASEERPAAAGSRPSSVERDHAAAEAALAGFLALPLPAVAAQLLAGEWRELLRRLHAEGDRDAWDAACTAAGELVWSVRLAPGSPERKMLLGRLPNLLKQLQDGFERLGLDAVRRVEILDALFGVHAAILRGEAPQSIPARARIVIPGGS